MYFQNPPTNFIDKFILIINPLQMNVNFFLGHQCKILRLYWGGFAICLGDEMPFVAALFVRETQDFASLQADAIIISCKTQ